MYKIRRTTENLGKFYKQKVSPFSLKDCQKKSRSTQSSAVSHEPQTEEIKDELSAQGIDTHSVIRMTNRKTQVPMPLFLISDSEDEDEHTNKIDTKLPPGTQDINQSWKILIFNPHH